MSVDIDDATTERLARRVHENYLREEMRRGRPMDHTGPMRPWDDLPEDFKRANRAQVADFAHNLASIGYQVRVVSPTSRDAEAVLRLALSDDEVEQLARREHDRFVAERTSQGWVYGEIRDDAARRHPLLCPWEALSEPNRDKDRAAVRNIPDLLAEAGFEVVRSS